MNDSEKTPSGTHVWLILIKAFHSIGGRVGPRLRKSGLGETDFRVLEVLFHKGALPVNLIGPKVYLTPGSISTAVDRLHRQGLVSRCENGEDRRVRIVDLTAKGRKLIARVFKNHAEDMERMVQVLSPAERIQLVHALKKLGRHAAASREGQ